VDRGRLGDSNPVRAPKPRLVCAFVDAVVRVRRLPSRWAAVDAVVYAAAAGFAAHSRGSGLLDYRTWAEYAEPAYAVGALGAGLLCVCGTTLSRRRLAAARSTIAIVVLVGAVALPLALEMRWRVERGPQYAQSEVLVTEEAAAQLLHGRNPYASHFTAPGFADRAPSIADHFPYLPGMAVPGVPHALAPHVAWTDARLLFALITAAASALAVSRWRAAPERRLTALQFLVLLPTGAPMLVTGGDDIPVLALSLLALVLLRERRHTASGATAAIAALLKLTAWPVLLAVLVTGATLQRAPRERLLRASPAVGALLVVTLAAAVGPASFLEDVLLFPLGLTTSPSPANSHTIGRMLLDPFDHLSPVSHTRVVLTGVLVGGAVLGSGVVLLWLARSSDPERPSTAAALGAAGVLLMLILLAPIGRSGYLIYPVDLTIWAAMLRSPPEAADNSVRSEGLVLLTAERAEPQPTG
jgi:glycosyl transferase family 87